jgi:isoleucyl-tRNA synthetase
VTRLLAPLTPFVAEEMYQNLMRSVDPSVPDSVHLDSFPVADPSLVDQQLMDATRLAMRISSMGRAARAKAGLKVRQPLAGLVVKTRTPEEQQYLQWVEPQVLEELNIKVLQPLEEAPDLRQQAQQTSGDEAEAFVAVGHYSVALDAGYMVAVDSALTPELVDEGLARELAHRIQNLRRDARFELTDRIITYYQGPAEIDLVMRNHAEYISQETLSEKLVAGAPEDGAKTETQKVEGMEVTLAVKRI